MHRFLARSLVALLTVAALVAGCGSSATPAPTGPSVAPNASPTATPLPSPPPTPSATPDPLVGQVVVTVSDNLVVRSEPRVSADSVMYRPWLPTGTELKVIDGPVSGSGYVWYEVEPVSFTGLDGPGHGWVAMAGKDGEPWIALAEPEIAGIELAKADVPRAPADPAAAKTAAASISAFGLDLLRAMLAGGTLKPDENAVVSPTSIALALGMARAGAKGETASQMDAVLHATGWDELGPGLNALEQALTSRNATWQDGSLDPPHRELALRIANASFAQRDWAIEQAYLDAIASTFGGGLRLVDYVAHPEAARQAINAWVSRQTMERIPELLGPGIVTPANRLWLVNAIYLKANWAAEFERSATKPLPFTRLDGSRVQVPTMSRQGTIPYATGTGWKATELHYLGAGGSTRLAMTLILPDDLASFESKLTASQIGRITATLEDESEKLGVITPGTSGEWCDEGTFPYVVKISMPRFGIETRADLVGSLRSLGMDLATGGTADFSGITSPSELFISAVIHQANIDVDEEGTEAAAATAVGGSTTGGCGGPQPLKVITLRLNRPFLFVLRDVETGAVLFMGRVVDPSVGR